MDRYSRGYDDRYRRYYDRPRSDTYRPGENYHSERDYRDGGGRNYSPNPNYSSSRSPGHSGGSGSRGDRYSYSDSRPYSSHYSSRGPSPSRSPSRSPRRPSYGYYRSGSSYLYNSRRSPSPVGGGRSGSVGRRDSYDHRPYHGSPSYSQYSPSSSYRGDSGHGRGDGGPYPSYSSRRHYSGPYPPSNYGPPSSGYYSREPSVGPPPSLNQPRSLHSTPFSTAPNSPHVKQESTDIPSTSSTITNPSQARIQSEQPAERSVANVRSATTSPNTEKTRQPSSESATSTAPPSAPLSAPIPTTLPRTSPAPSTPASTAPAPAPAQAQAPAPTPLSSTAPVPGPVSTPASTTSVTNVRQGGPSLTKPAQLSLNSYNYGPSSSAGSSYHNPPVSSSPYERGPLPPLRHGGGPPHRSYHHSPHYSSYHPPSSATMPPIRKRTSWAPDLEKEMERHRNEQKRLCEEETKILSAVRKSRFELELANRDAKKLDNQLALVQKQWEENGMEEAATAQ